MVWRGRASQRHWRAGIGDEDPGDVVVGHRSAPSPSQFPSLQPLTVEAARHLPGAAPAGGAGRDLHFRKRFDSLEGTRRELGQRTGARPAAVAGASPSRGAGRSFEWTCQQVFRRWRAGRDRSSDIVPRWAVWFVAASPQVGMQPLPDGVEDDPDEVALPAWSGSDRTRKRFLQRSRP
jgi:hypothetical protein